MGADLDPQDSIAQLANAHFPELSTFDESGAGGATGMDGLTNLDFMNLGEAAEWGALHKDWNHGAGDLDGFPSQNGFDMGFGAGSV